MSIRKNGMLIIINPVSGPARRGRASRRLEQAELALKQLGVSATIRLTEHAGHAHEIAEAAVSDGVELVVAWGGDGTINEVARAIAGSARTSLGIIPGGSGNGLARELDIPFNPERALAHALRSPPRAVDAGEVGGHLFFNVAGVGLDAHVAEVVGARQNRRGLLPYLLASGRDLLRYLPVDYSIVADGSSMETTAVIVALANSRQYGFGARIAPTAAVDDGLLDLVLVEDRRLIGNLARLPSVFAGTFDRTSGVTVVKVREATIRSNSPMIFHVDGEAVDGKLELNARVHAGALRLCA